MFRESWNSNDLETVRKMNKAGSSVATIADFLNRTDDAVRSVIKKINLLRRFGYKANTKAYKTLLAKGENQLRATLRGY